MTISESEREYYQSTVSTFQRQPTPDACLPTALKNVLDRLAEEHEEPELSIALSDLNSICDYRDGMGSASYGLSERLDPEIVSAGYETQISIGTGWDQLNAIIQSEKSSLPLVELSPEYFESVDGYNVQPGRDGLNLSHIVIPFAVNDESVLFFDPMEAFFRPNDTNATPSTERAKAQFYEWWSAPRKRWTLWFKQTEQQPLDKYQE